MRTYKPISTISYNSPPYLELMLNSLFDKKVIKAWMFIPHKGEEGDKDHIHVYVEPAEQVDTESYDFTEHFNEVDPSNEKPLGVTFWQKSKAQDWLLYVLHDKAYLESKGEKRQFYDYSIDEVQAHDALYPMQIMETVDRFSLLTPIEKVIFCINEHMTMLQAMKKCKIAYGAMGAFMNIWHEIQLSARPKYEKQTYFNPDTCEKTTFYVDLVTGEEITEAEFKYRMLNHKVIL